MVLATSDVSKCS